MFPDWSMFANHAITVERKTQSGSSPTGEPLSTTVTIYTGLACQIEQIAGQAAIEVTIGTVVYLQTHTLVIDGLLPAQVTSGQTTTINGVAYVNVLRGAFVDLKPGDRVTDERGQTYLVIDTGNVTDILPHTQARLAQGKAW